MEFLKSLKSDYELWLKKPKTYKKKVDKLSDFFNLKNNHRFVSNYLPSGFSGRFDKKDQFVMFGLNPGFKRDLNKREELEQMQNWNSYVNARKNLYLFFKKLNHPSDYYRKFWLLFSSLVKDSSKYHTQWDFYDQNLTNLNLFPFHSKGFSISKKLSNEQFEFLQERFEELVNFITKYKPRLFLFNGKPWEVLLINHGLVKNYDRVPVTKDFILYFFKVGKTPSILFEKFFPRHFWLNNEHRQKIIPDLIMQQYPKQF